MFIYLAPFPAHVIVSDSLLKQNSQLPKRLANRQEIIGDKGLASILLFKAIWIDH